MGNCQAAEAATVLIHHPAENKVERIYWSVTASDVMKSNPGHYVAVVVTSPTMKNEKGSPLKQLKLLRPDDTLLIGHVYRLVSFEEVLNEFATKKCVKLGKLLKEGGGLDLTKKTKKHRKKKLDQETARVNPDPNQDEANDAKRKMGNCQAAEAATVLIHHPAENKVERIYWSVTASDVMKSNPGHYVAVVVTSPTMKNEKGSPLKQLKLLRPDDTLLIGHVYRLVSFEEVLNEFATKKCVKLGKLLKEGGGLDLTKKKTKKHSRKKLDQETGRVNPDPNQDGANDAVTGENGGDGFMRRSHGGGRGGGGWRPALHSIPEFGSS